LLPTVYVFFFLFLFGFLNDYCNDYNYDQDSKYRSKIYLWIGIVCIIPGLLISTCIYICIVRKNVPNWLKSLYDFLSFIQSIAWIKFSSGFIVDLLKLPAFIFGVP